MKYIFQKFLFTASIIYLLWPLPSAALGLLVKPQKLELTSYPAKIQSAEIMIMNNSDQPALYLISPGNWQNQISVDPKELKLEPNESKIVKVSGRFFLPGLYKTDIAVIAKSLSAGDMAAVPGVKVSYELKISRWFSVLSLGVALLFCLVLFFGVKWLLFEKRNDNKA